MYFVKRVTIPLLSLNEPRRKVATDNNSRWICKQAIIKLSLAHSFRKVFFIGFLDARSHDIFFSRTFYLLLVNCSWYLMLGVLKKIFLTTPKKNYMQMQTSWERNQSWNKNKHFNLFLVLMLKKPVF